MALVVAGGVCACDGGAGGWGGGCWGWLGGWSVLGDACGCECVGCLAGLCLPSCDFYVGGWLVCGGLSGVAWLPLGV